MSMTVIGAYEAKTHLPRLLAQVEKGESFTITRHGREVARLVPIDISWPKPGGVVLAFRAARQGVSLGGDSIRELIAEGRR